jgi:hypothetical protein
MQLSGLVYIEATDSPDTSVFFKLQNVVSHNATPSEEFAAQTVQLVGIATGYALEVRGVSVPVPVG